MNFIKDTIKQLKRDYGTVGTVYKLISNVLDLEFGTKRSTFRYKVVNRIIFLPTGVTRFTTYDPDTRTVLIDKQDIFEIEVSDFIINGTTTYNVIEVQDYNDVAYQLKIKSSDTALLEFGIIADTITFDEVVTYEL